jgi:hypothetical protein
MPSLLHAVVLAQAMTLTVEDRAEVRLRSFEGTEYVDAETRPRLVLGASASTAGAATSWELNYSPSFMVLGLGTPESDLLLYHNGTARTSIRGRRTELVLTQSVEYGTRNFRVAVFPAAPAAPSGEGVPGAPAPTNPGALPAGQAQMVNQTLEFGGTASSALVTHALTRRTLFAQEVGFSASGGLGETSSEVFPLQRGPWATSNFGYRLSSRDTLWTSGDARFVETGSGRRVDLLNVTERWASQLTRRQNLELAAGITLSRQETLAQPEPLTEPELGVHPVGSAAWSYTAQYLRLGTTAALALVVDRMTGAADERSIFDVFISRRTGRVTWQAILTGTRSLDMNTPNSLASVATDLGVVWTLNSRLTADCGVRTNWNTFAGQEPTTMWIAYVGVTGRAAPFRF